MQKMISCQFGSWKQVLTDQKAYEPRFRANVSIYEKRLYISILSGVRSSGHRVKPNMAANRGPNLRQSQSPYAVFHVYMHV